MGLLFERLPIEILHEILLHYLSGKGKYSFLQTTKRYASLRKQLQYYSLKGLESQSYLIHWNYKQKILSSLYNPSLQLSICLEHKILPATFLDFASVLPVHRLKILGYEQLHNFELLKTMTIPLGSLEIAGCSDEIDLDYCQGIKELTFIRCSNLLHVDRLHSQVKHLQLMNSCKEIVNVQPFAHLQSLLLGDCYQLEDISPLQNIPQLTIKRCPNVRNIDCLIYNQSLWIEQCRGIQQITFHHTIMKRKSFVCRNCTSLEICKMKNGWIDMIRFESCRLLTTLSLVLIPVHELSLSWCDSLFELDQIHQVETISLIQCDHFRRFLSSSQMIQLQSLNLEKCEEIECIDTFPQVENLIVSFCSQLRLIQNLPECKKLTIHGCNQLQIIENLPNCIDAKLLMDNEQFQKLQMINCPSFINTVPFIWWW